MRKNNKLRESSLQNIPQIHKKMALGYKKERKVDVWYFFLKRQWWMWIKGCLSFMKERIRSESLNKKDFLRHYHLYIRCLDPFLNKVLIFWYKLSLYLVHFISQTPLTMLQLKERPIDFSRYETHISRDKEHNLAYGA